MYTSKYYTCEQIDERLLQGYYDDAVANGFTGNKAEFWEKILSIPGVITALGNLKKQHDDYVISTNKLLVEHLSTVNTQLDSKISDLRNVVNQSNSNFIALFSDVNTKLAKIQPLTEEEVSTLVNDALES